MDKKRPISSGSYISASSWLFNAVKENIKGVSSKHSKV